MLLLDLLFVVAALIGTAVYTPAVYNYARTFTAIWRARAGTAYDTAMRWIENSIQGAALCTAIVLMSVSDRAMLGAELILTVAVLVLLRIMYPAHLQRRRNFWTAAVVALIVLLITGTEQFRPWLAATFSVIGSLILSGLLIGFRALGWATRLPATPITGRFAWFGRLVSRLGSTASGLAIFATRILGSWITLLITVAILSWFETDTGVQTHALRFGAIALILGLMAFGLRYAHGPIRGIGAVVSVLMVALMISPLIPKPVKEYFHYSVVRSGRVAESMVQRHAATGRIYYVLTDTAPAMLCEGACRTVSEADGEPGVQAKIDSFRFFKLLPPGTRLVSVQAKLLTINETMFAAVAPERADHLGYDTRTIYLVPKDLLTETSSDPYLVPRRDTLPLRPTLVSEKVVVYVPAPAPKAARTETEAPAPDTAAEESTEATKPGSYGLEVPPSVQEFHTGIFLAAGDTAVISANGRYTCDASDKTVGPNGAWYTGTQAESSSEFLLPQAHACELVGKVGDEKWLEIGTGAKLAVGVDEGGELILSVNDRREGFSNQGRLHVDVTIK